MMAQRSNLPAALPAFAIFDDYRPTVTISVVIRWLLLGTWFFLNNYRVETGAVHLTLNLLGTGLALLNGYMTWRLAKGWPVTWRHALTLSIADLTLITVGLFLRGGLANDFYVFFYPALLGFSLMFPKRASFPIAAAVIGLYTVMAFTVPPKFELAAMDEKLLAVRLACMVGIVGAGALITGWERARRRDAVAAERQRSQENLELQRQAQQAELLAVAERSRIGRDIHDGISQSLYMLNLGLEACAGLAQQGQESLQQRLQALARVARQTLLETRQYILDLKPMLDGGQDLVQALENQAGEFATVTAIETGFESPGQAYPLPSAIGTALVRIAQEGLSNVYRHAGASRVEVKLVYHEESVELHIQDDGGGFDQAAAPAGRGLSNMTQRALELDGVLEIDASVGRGVRVKVVLPVKSHDKTSEKGNAETAKN
jgi:signal transduction histidine kinase